MAPSRRSVLRRSFGVAALAPLVTLAGCSNDEDPTSDVTAGRTPTDTRPGSDTPVGITLGDLPVEDRRLVEETLDAGGSLHVEYLPSARFEAGFRLRYDGVDYHVDALSRGLRVVDFTEARRITAGAVRDEETVVAYATLSAAEQRAFDEVTDGSDEVDLRLGGCDPSRCVVRRGDDHYRLSSIHADVPRYEVTVTRIRATTDDPPVGTTARSAVSYAALSAAEREQFDRALDAGGRLESFTPFEQFEERTLVRHDGTVYAAVSGESGQNEAQYRLTASRVSPKPANETAAFTDLSPAAQTAVEAAIEDEYVGDTMPTLPGGYVVYEGQTYTLSGRAGDRRIWVLTVTPVE